MSMFSSLHQVQLRETKGLLLLVFCLAGCGTGSSVIEFCFRVGGVFSLEAPEDVPVAAVVLPVIKLK